MTAVGYVRVSTAEQVHGFGLEVQETAIAKYCAEAGLELLQVFRDEGKSGSNGLESRVGLADALALCESLKATLVVMRLDRLARTLIVQETTIARARAAGASVVSVAEADVDSDDPTRVLVRQVLGAIGQYERALIRARMTAGKAAKVAKGGYGGGRPPYGYQAVGSTLVPDEDEQATLARMRAFQVEGLSTRAIAERLTAGGMLTRSGGPWSGAQVWQVLNRGQSSTPPRPDRSTHHNRPISTS